MRGQKCPVARKIGAVLGKMSTDHRVQRPRAASTRSVARKLPAVRRSIAAVRMSGKPDAAKNSAVRATAHVVHEDIVAVSRKTSPYRLTPRPAARLPSRHTGKTEPVSPSDERDS